MEQHREKRSNKALLGIVLILVGLVLVGNQFNLVPGNLRDIFFTWQGLLILIGIIFMSRRDNKATGYILVGIGIFFMIPEVFDVPYEWRRLFWPIMIIFIGVAVLFGTTFRYRRHLN